MKAMTRTDETRDVIKWLGLAFAAATAIAMFSGDADASERHRPKERPVISKSSSGAGFVARRFTSQEMMTAAFGRAWLCENYEDEVNRMKLSCE